MTKLLPFSNGLYFHPGFVRPGLSHTANSPSLSHHQQVQTASLCGALVQFIVLEKLDLLSRILCSRRLRQGF